MEQHYNEGQRLIEKLESLENPENLVVDNFSLIHLKAEFDGDAQTRATAGSSVAEGSASKLIKEDMRFMGNQ